MRTCIGNSSLDPLNAQVPHLYTAVPENYVHEQRFGFSIPFTSLPCLELDSLFRLPPDDVRFLETKGCLHIPRRQPLDELVRHYFLHVHPFLPVINEADFWKAYNQNHKSDCQSSTSLFIFQAMLSVSCVVSIVALSSQCLKIHWI